jgi:hypothetical protein
MIIDVKLVLARTVFDFIFDELYDLLERKYETCVLILCPYVINALKLAIKFLEVVFFRLIDAKERLKVDSLNNFDEQSHILNGP